MENVLVRSLYVNQIFVYGDSYKNYLVAIVVPREETCVEFLKTKGIETTKDNVTEFYDDEDLKKAVLKDFWIILKIIHLYIFIIWVMISGNLMNI